MNSNWGSEVNIIAKSRAIVKSGKAVDKLAMPLAADRNFWGLKPPVSMAWRIKSEADPKLEASVLSWSIV